MVQRVTARMMIIIGCAVCTTITGGSIISGKTELLFIMLYAHNFLHKCSLGGHTFNIVLYTTEKLSFFSIKFTTN